jgi:hypothetical protein
VVKPSKPPTESAEVTFQVSVVAKVPNSDESDAQKPNSFKVKKPTARIGVSGLNGLAAKFKEAPIRVSKTLTVTLRGLDNATIHTPLNEAKHRNAKERRSSLEFARVVL